MVRGFQRQLFPVWAYALLLLGMLCGAMTAQAGITPAGTKISNLATVTYKDALDNEFTAYSNESVVKVAEIYSADLLQDQEKDGAASQKVYFQHQLINNGNTQDTFQLSFTGITGIKQEQLTIYQDDNGNGQPDHGELEVKVGDKIIIASGSIVNLVVEAALSDKPAEKSEFQLVAKSTDRAKGAKSFEKANTDKINLVTGPVLVATKEVVTHIPATNKVDGSITYRITVKNNGTKLTEPAAIRDSLSEWLTVANGNVVNPDSGGDTGVVITNPINPNFDKENITVESGLASGEYQANHSLQIPIVKLPANSITSFEFTVKYKHDAGFTGGQYLPNIAVVDYNVNGVPTQIKSNLTKVKLPQFYGLEVHNQDGANEEDHKHDESGDTEAVGSVAKGEEAKFKIWIKNTGNGPDRFNLEPTSKESSFPAGTNFTFWDSTGAIQYKDAVTPVVAAEQGVMIMVKAKIPGPEEFNIADIGKMYKKEIQASSTGDKNQKGTVWLQLDEITDVISRVDLSYEDKKDSKDLDLNKYGEASTEKNTRTVEPGKSATYKLWVQNDSTNSRYFTLKGVQEVSGGRQDNYEQSKKLPDGWVVLLKDGNQPATSTLTFGLKAGAKKQLTVELTLPQSVGIGNHHFGIIAQSEEAKNGAKINDAISFYADVPLTGKLTLTPNGSNQIEAGGSVFYNHILKNNSNKDVTVHLSGVHDDDVNGWTHTLSSKSSLVKILDGGFLVATLPAGEFVDIQAKVMAPANAVPGSKDILKLSATELLQHEDEEGDYILVEKGLKAEATDVTTVIKGQVRLYKGVHVLKLEQFQKATAEKPTDAEILSASAGLNAVSDFTTNSQVKPVPGEDYVVWQIIATNEGDAPATQVTIRDAAPAYTTYVSGSAYVIGGERDTKDIGKGKVVSDSDSEIVFNVGEGATDTSNGSGGTLQPGQSVEVRFTVKVN